MELNRRVADDRCTTALMAAGIAILLSACAESGKPVDNLAAQAPAARPLMQPSNQLSFPAQIALAAYGTKHEDHATTNSGSSESNTMDCLSGQFCVARRDAIRLEPLGECLAEKGQGTGRASNPVVANIEKFGPIKKAEAQEAVHLLRTGEFAKEISKNVRGTLSKIGPQNLANSLGELPEDIWKQAHDPQGIVPKVADSFLHIGNCFREQALQGRRCLINAVENPGILESVYKLTVARDMADTISALIASDNRTTRLAIIVFARTHGIDLTESDLDNLQQALDTDEPELKPLIYQGVLHLQQKYGVEHAQRKLAAMQKSSATACS